MSRSLLSLAAGAALTLGSIACAFAAPKTLLPGQMDHITAGQIQLLVPQAISIGSSTALATGVQTNAATQVVLQTDTTGALAGPGMSYSMSSSSGIATSLGQ